MDHQQAVGWVEFIRDAGGWGIAVIEAAVIVIMARHIVGLNRDVMALLDKKSRELLEAANDARRGG